MILDLIDDELAALRAVGRRPWAEPDTIEKVLEDFERGAAFQRWLARQQRERKRGATPEDAVTEATTATMAGAA